MEEMRYVTTPFRVDDDDDDNGYASDVENWNDECDITAAWLQHLQAWRSVLADVRCHRLPVTACDVTTACLQHRQGWQRVMTDIWHRRRSVTLIDRALPSAYIYIPPSDNAAH